MKPEVGHAALLRRIRFWLLADAEGILVVAQPEPEFRPPMSEVVQALVRLVQRANMSKRIGSADEQEAARRADDPDVQDFMF